MAVKGNEARVRDDKKERSTDTHTWTNLKNVTPRPRSQTQVTCHLIPVMPPGGGEGPVKTGFLSGAVTTF